MGSTEKPVVELGSFSILNPKPPGSKVAFDGDFSVDDGNAAKGAKLFKAKCASCHTIKEGGAPCGASWVGRLGRVSLEASVGPETRASGLLAHYARVPVPRPEHARAKSPRDNGSSGWKGDSKQRCTHQMTPCT